MGSRAILGGVISVCAAVLACSAEREAPRPTPLGASLDARLTRVAEQSRDGLVRQGGTLVSRGSPWLVTRLGERASESRSVAAAGAERWLLRITEPGAGSVPVELDAGIATYRDAYLDTDLVWLAAPAQNEELWVLRSERAPSRFAWELELGSDLTSPAPAPDGSFVFGDRSGRALLRMPRPYAVDASGQRHDVSVSFDPEARAFTFSLEHASLPHPVVVDPSLVTVSHWKQVLPTTSPSARSGASMVYSPATQSILLFGGVGCATLPSCLKNDVWELKNGQWQMLTTSGSVPAARAYATWLWDSNLSTLRLYGGFDGTQALPSEHWFSATGQWTSAVLVALPGSREGHAAAYVPSASKMLLAFGQNGGALFFDPWLGMPWSSVASAGPAARRDTAMLHDPTLDRTLVLGGRPCARGQTCSPLGDVWQRSGSSWSTLSATGSVPPARFGHSMAYDDKLLVSVVFGGRTAAGLSSDTYELDGSSFWQNDKTPQKPPARAHAAMAYDAARGVMVLFGGNPSAGEAEASTTHLDDTWEYAPTSITCTQPSDCATGFCVDAVCCETASCGTCQSCATPGSPGKCASVDGADADSCPQGTCSAGACVKPFGSTCSAGSECQGGQCNGGVCCPTACSDACASCATGSCQPVAAGTASASCGAYVCNGTATTCPTSCAGSADCAQGHVCDTATSTCLLTAGNTCSAASECASGFCTDGVCCESACDGECEQCGSAGTCDPAPAGSEKSATCPAGCSGQSRSCAALTCDTGSQCTSGICIGGRCCATLYDCGTKCSSDGKSELDTLTGQETPCPYGCFFGRCASGPVDCRVGGACAADEICTSAGLCAKSGAPAGGQDFEPGTPLGCLCEAPGGGRPAPWGLAALLGGAALARSRRRRKDRRL